MFVLILEWDFSGQDSQLLLKLRDYIARESWARYRSRKGLRQKVWFSHEETLRWGAFYLWESKTALLEEVNSMGRVEDMTGIAPEVSIYEVEAIQEGMFCIGDLTAVGMARRRSGQVSRHSASDNMP